MITVEQISSLILNATQKGPTHPGLRVAVVGVYNVPSFPGKHSMHPRGYRVWLKRTKAFTKFWGIKAPAKVFKNVKDVSFSQEGEAKPLAQAYRTRFDYLTP